jgi:hypothetical protein
MGTEYTLWNVRQQVITSNNFELELHHPPHIKDVIESHLQSFLVLIRPILFRQPLKNKEDDFLHPIIDCVNVFLFQMVNTDVPPFSTFHDGEKIEDFLIEIIVLPLTYNGALTGQRSSKLQNICAKFSLQSSGRLA